MNEKLTRLMSATFGLAPEAIFPDAAMTNTPEWDSLAHLNLCLSIEEAFHIRLLPEEIMELTSVSAIEAVLARHSAA